MPNGHKVDTCEHCGLKAGPEFVRGNECVSVPACKARQARQERVRKETYLKELKL